jgi:hypothetical protein
MNKNILFIVSGALLFSCTNTSEKTKFKNSSALFGWTETHVDSLRNECLGRYGSSHPEKSDKLKEDYCNCLVEKIIYSVNYEQHINPNDETVKLYEEFSRTCGELSKSEE